MTGQRLQDIITEEGSVCHGLDYRIAPIEPCTIPGCDCQKKEIFALVVRSGAGEHWAVAGFSTNPETMLANMAADPDVERICTSVVLYGTTWEKVVHEPLYVYQTQCQAVKETPQRYWELDLVNLEDFRGLINTNHPLEICVLLNLTDKWAFDEGGTNGGAPS